MKRSRKTVKRKTPNDESQGRPLTRDELRQLVGQIRANDEEEARLEAEAAQRHARKGHGVEGDGDDESESGLSGADG